jgi:hypothetical protein
MFFSTAFVAFLAKTAQPDHTAGELQGAYVARQ